jgi:hypothetical protein
MGIDYGYIFIDRCVVCEILVERDFTQRQQGAETAKEFF